jgi:hypothetical protein
MKHTIVALYASFEAAREAAQDLHRNGYKHEDINLIAHDAEQKYARFLQQNGQDPHQGAEVADSTMTGAATGTVLGTALGMLVAGAALTVPGLGPIIAAGPVATLLATTGAGALAGAAVGSAVGALTAMGVPDEDAALYAEGLRRGGALVTLQAPVELVPSVSSILERHDPVDIEEASARWREEGWNPPSEHRPMTPQEIDRERVAAGKPLYIASNTPTREVPVRRVRALAKGSVQIKDPDLAVGDQKVS